MGGVWDPATQREAPLPVEIPTLINNVLEEFSKQQSIHNVHHTCKIAS